LHWASKRNHDLVVRYLLEIGASPDALNNDNKTPYDYTKNLNVKRLLRPGNFFSFY
jgi:ankyrin repeat protein